MVGSVKYSVCGVLMLVLAGCAASGDLRSQAAVTLPDVAGTWRGTFWQVGQGDTAYYHGEIVLRINNDASYEATWKTHLVAGSTRGGTVDLHGRITAHPKYVVLEDWRRMALKRRGHTLYGLTIDPSSGRTVAVRLEKEP